MPDIGRNDPCHCGSGKKYKKCCQDKDVKNKHTAHEKEWTKSVKEFEKVKKDEEAEAATKPPVPVKHQPRMMGNIHQQKHSGSVAPRVNMPRKSGGGGA